MFSHSYLSPPKKVYQIKITTSNSNLFQYDNENEFWIIFSPPSSPGEEEMSLLFIQKLNSQSH